MAENAVHARIRFRRLSRMPRESPGTLFAASSSVGRKAVQDLTAGVRRQTVRVVNRPARHPTGGTWPLELRADMVAALLDFGTTRELCKAVAAGTAPRPGAVRESGASREVVWSLEAVKQFVAARHHVRDGDARDADV